MHPLHQCNDGKFNTVTGKTIDLINPTPAMIHLQDIAYGLSNIVRFGGQMKQAYTVAQHSILTAYLAPNDLKLEALLHDAAEAYLGDVIKPLKHLLGAAYSDLETKMEAAIFESFGLDPERVKLVKPYDIQAVEIENGFRFDTPEYQAKRFHRLFGTTVWTHDYARDMFIRNYFLFRFRMELDKTYLETETMNHPEHPKPCTECAGTGNMSIEKDTVHIPCTFCDATGISKQAKTVA